MESGRLRVIGSTIKNIEPIHAAFAQEWEEGIVIAKRVANGVLPTVTLDGKYRKAGGVLDGRAGVDIMCHMIFVDAC